MGEAVPELFSGDQPINQQNDLGTDNYINPIISAKHND